MEHPGHLPEIYTVKSLCSIKHIFAIHCWVGTFLCWCHAWVF